MPHDFKRRDLLAAGGALGLLMASLRATTAQAADIAFPTQPIRVIIPFTPGGSTDFVSRGIGQPLAERWKQPFVIDNRAGAGGSIGTEELARSKPDGYTWGIGSSATIAINPHIYNQKFSTLTDLVPVVQISDAPNVLVVHPSLPVKTLAELIAYAKAEKGKLSYASNGVGTSAHLSGFVLAQQAHFEAIHIPYKGMIGVNDLLGGRVGFMFGTIPSFMQHIKAGTLRALAVSSLDRARSLPEIPTIAEQGFPGFSTSSWNGFFMPKGTPAAIVAKANRDVNQILSTPQLQDMFVDQGLNPKGKGSPADFAAFIKPEWERWRGIVKASGVTAT
jgi:tripartite-type tricarboxylate transporter receptor subunit TctC